MPRPPKESSRSASSGDPVRPEPSVGARLGRARLSELLTAHGLRPSRALGQNFLVDPNTADRIVRLAGVGPGDRVLEIGAGLGSLTTALAASGAAVTAVEVDRRLAAVLREEVAPAGVRVVEADAMTTDWSALLDGPGWVLVANLPYNVATPLVVEMLESVPAVARMLVMVQLEAGQRLAAPPGSRVYGAVSVKVSYWAEAAVVATVPPTVFLPRPRVDSVLVRIERRARPAVDPSVVAYARLVEVVGAGFAQRRKMLRSALAGVVAPEAFARAGIPPTARAEDLGVGEWGRLAALPSPPRPAPGP